MAQNTEPYTAVPTVEPSIDGSGSRYQSVPEANPAAFGSGIGEAAQKAGGELQQTGNKAIDVASDFNRMATDARVENDFANQYATGAADLRQKFDMLDDNDKIGGSVAYLSGLNGLGQRFTGEQSQASPYYKERMSGLIGRHIFSETTGINREVVDSTLRLGAQGKMSLMAANNGYAAQNYDNPTVVDQMSDANSGLRTLQVMDAGHDPTTPDGAATLEEYQRQDTGAMADGMVKAAVSEGNIAAAMRIRGTYNNSIPGYQQLAQDNLIHTASMRQFGTAGVSSLSAGQTIPSVISAPPVQVQAVVANTAQASGINPNDALTVAQIESSMGKNVGTRGTIGQDKGSAGQPLDAQAKALCDNWKAAHDPAATALGREPQGWEQYTVYQQGAGGGAALLKADPNAKAVNILKPLYANPKDALSAIVNNGGNAAMTVSDFLNQNKQRWTDSAERAHCDFNPATREAAFLPPTSGPLAENAPLLAPATLPGDQILAAHQAPGTVVQPGANPAQDFRNWERANILNMQQIMAMPSGPAREALLKENQFQTAKRQGAATAYKNELTIQATQLMADPKFSMDMVSSEMYSALAEEHPQTLIAMQNRAKEKQGGVAKEVEENGPAFHQLNVGTQQGAEVPTTPEAINKAYNDGQITAKAQDYLLSKTIGKKSMTPQEENYKKNVEEYAKVELGYTGVNSMPESIAAYSKFSIALDAYLGDPKIRDKGAQDIYDLSEGSPLNKLVKSFEPSYGNMLPSPTQKPGLFSHTPSVPKQEDLEVGKTYNSPKYGQIKWTGTGFVKVGQ